MMDAQRSDSAGFPGAAGLLVLLAAFFALATAYAFRTPPWNVPDEPSHFTFLRYVAETGSLPILQQGDFVGLMPIQAAVGSRSFAAPVDIRYESHQPPLYYLIGALVDGAARSAGLGSNGVAYALRLYSVTLATLTVAVVYGIGRLAVPESRSVAFAAAGLVAFLPMHLAIAAGINNDNLANLLGAALMWLCLARLAGSVQSTGFMLAGALLCGAMLLTKASLYGMVVVLPPATEIGASSRAASPRWQRVAWTLATLYTGALLIAGWWFVRNVALYGAGDWLGMRRHDLMMAEYVRVAERPQTLGDPRAHLEIMLERTRMTFWGVFGWYWGFFAPRTYDVLNTLAALGALGWLWRWRHPLDRPRPALCLLVLALLQELALYVVWNLKFVQGQARAFFPALGAIAVLGCIGLREIARPLPLVVDGILAVLAVYALWFLIPVPTWALQ